MRTGCGNIPRIFQVTINEIMTTPNAWQDSEVTVFHIGSYIGSDKGTWILCSDEDGFFLCSESGVEIREFEELGDDVDRLQISIVY